MRRYLPGLLVLALVGCGSGEPSSNTDSPASSPSPTADSGAAAPVTLQCTPEGASPFTEASVIVTPQGEDIRASWGWKGTPPAGGTFGLFLTLTDTDQQAIHQLGLKMLDGQQIAFFDFDMGTAQQKNLAPTAVPAMKDTGIALTFKGSGEPFKEGFTAKAAVSVEGNDVMSCA